MTTAPSLALPSTAMPQKEKRLLDWFEPAYDPDGLISRMVLRLDQLAAKRGVRLYPQTDFHPLTAIVEAHRNEGTVQMPHVNPVYSTIGAANAFWLYGIDQEGKSATTQTGRCYDFTGTSLAEELASFRFFYDDPSKHLTTECFVRTPPAASRITGTAVASGTIWVRPDLRGPDEDGIILSSVLSKLTRLISISRWWPDTLFTFSSYALHNRGVVRNFGYMHEAFPVDWVFPFGRAPSSGMFWISRDELIAWTAEGFRQPAAA